MTKGTIMPARAAYRHCSMALGPLLCVACTGIGEQHGTTTSTIASPMPSGTTTTGTTTGTTTTAGATTAGTTAGTTTAGTTAGTTTAGTTAGTTTAGTTTAGTTAGTTTTGTTTAGGNTLLTSLDFEDSSLHDWALLDYNYQPIAGTNTGVGSGVTTDDAAHGTHSLKAVGGPGFTDAVWLTNTSLFPITPNQLYVRFYIKLMTALVDSHTTFAVVDGTGGGASGSSLTEVRMGGQFRYLVANLQLNDSQRRSGGNAGDPETAPGVPLTVNTWYCMEILYDGVGPSMRTWLNGNEIVDLAVLAASDWSSPPSTPQWMPNMAHLKLGWAELWQQRRYSLSRRRGSKPQPHRLPVIRTCTQKMCRDFCDLLVLVAFNPRGPRHASPNPSASRREPCLKQASKRSA